MSAPLVKFVTSLARLTIEQVACTRETDSSVFIEKIVRASSGDHTEESRHAKRGEVKQFHDTWELARDYLMERAERGVTHARRRLELANAELGNIKGMKPPKEGV
jgi:hypothetical protein